MNVGFGANTAKLSDFDQDLVIWDFLGKKNEGKKNEGKKRRKKRRKNGFWEVTLV